MKSKLNQCISEHKEILMLNKYSEETKVIIMLSFLEERGNIYCN